jgi:hypothetical protein
MATYAELYGLQADTGISQRIVIATIIAAEAARAENVLTYNHEKRMQWARSVFANPEFEGRRMMWAVFAQHKDLTLAQITAATDAAIQTAVNTAVNLFAV